MFYYSDVCSRIRLYRAIVGETGGGQNANCYAQLNELFKYLAANDEYIGWTGWAAGPRMSLYPT
jgi:hypothetical protein